MIFAWMKANEAALRDEFENLDVLEYRRSFDECLAIVTAVLKKA